jgi:hypothetical protein
MAQKLGSGESFGWEGALATAVQRSCQVILFVSADAEYRSARLAHMQGARALHGMQAWLHPAAPCCTAHRCVAYNRPSASSWPLSTAGRFSDSVMSRPPGSTKEVHCAGGVWRAVPARALQGTCEHDVHVQCTQPLPQRQAEIQANDTESNPNGGMESNANGDTGKIKAAREALRPGPNL